MSTAPLFIPIDLTENFIGGLLRISKKHFEWKVELDKTRYTIELECSYLTNKRRVYVQKQLMTKAIKCALDRAVGQSFLYTFPLNKHVVTVKNSGTEADLSIDNVSFRALYYAGISAASGPEPYEIQIPVASSPQTKPELRDPYLAKLWSMSPEERKIEHETKVKNLQQTFGLIEEPKKQDLLDFGAVAAVTKPMKSDDFLDFGNDSPGLSTGQSKPESRELPAKETPKKAFGMDLLDGADHLSGPVKGTYESLFALDADSQIDRGAGLLDLHAQEGLIDSGKPSEGSLLDMGRSEVPHHSPAAAMRQTEFDALFDMDSSSAQPAPLVLPQAEAKRTDLLFDLSPQVPHPVTSLPSQFDSMFSAPTKPEIFTVPVAKPVLSSKAKEEEEFDKLFS